MKRLWRRILDVVACELRGHLWERVGPVSAEGGVGLPNSRLVLFTCRRCEVVRYKVEYSAPSGIPYWTVKNERREENVG